MVTIPDRRRVNIHGPFWFAAADIIEIGQPQNHRAFRDLFLDLTSREVSEKVLLPGTRLVVAYAREVRIVPDPALQLDYEWTRGTADRPDRNVSPAQLRRLLRDGTLSLLLLQADPVALQDGDRDRDNRTDDDNDDDNGDSARDSACLAGEVSLDVLAPRRDARQRLVRALALREEPLGDRSGAAGLTAGLSVDAGGLSVLASTQVPWQDARIVAPFRLARLQPDPLLPSPPGPPVPRPGYRLSIDAARLTPGEEAALRAAWQTLSRSLDPGNPLLGAGRASVPTWVSLEVANPLGLPRIFWSVAPWQEERQTLPLHFEPGEIDLVLSDDHLHGERPPTSVARVELDELRIERTLQGELHVHVNAGQQDAGLAGEISYAATRGNRESWQETFRLTDAELAYHPVEAPRRLREIQGLPSPTWVPGKDARPLADPILWAWMPLEDGWTQLPVPNLTEQMYLDAGLVTLADAVPSPSLLQGGVSYGNDSPTALAAAPDEQPWSVTITNAQSLRGTWVFDRDGSALVWQLDRVSLAIEHPGLVVGGLLWLSNESSTHENSLPELANWTTGLSSLPLAAVQPARQLFAPLVKIAIFSLEFSRRRMPRPEGALLGPWSFSYLVDSNTMRSMVNQRLLPADAFSRHLALAWRRHGSLPMIQALPLTQNRTPPNYPSASRELMPFELDVAPAAEDPALLLPDNWKFGVTGPNGAAEWAILQTSVAPAREWRSVSDIPMVSLSLPGLIMDPRRDPASTGLGADDSTGLALQYRLDLPYTDQVHALAHHFQRKTEASGDVGDATGSRPLQRGDLAGHWRKLSQHASLAAASDTGALELRGNQVELHHLIEPFAWPVVPGLRLDGYPGTLRLANVRAAPAHSIMLTGEQALQSVSGRFALDAENRLHLSGDDAAPLAVTACSMAAQVAQDGVYRDQRGLLRSASQKSDLWFRTPTQLVNGTAYELTSTRSALPLRVGTAPDTGLPVRWHLWFRDLPCDKGHFDRRTTLSPQAQDVNDPEAVSRAFQHLSGYEWRLAPPTMGAPYLLFHLRFYPLTLEEITIEAETLRHVELNGRLQLPLVGAGEMETLANVVRFGFDYDEATKELHLTSLSLVSSVVEWPLETTRGESGTSRLVCKRIGLNAAGDGIDIDEAELVFFLFAARWTIGLERLSFSAMQSVAEQRYVADHVDPGEALFPQQLLLRLDVKEQRYDVALVMAARLGEALRHMPAGPRPRKLRWILQDPAPPGGQPSSPSGDRSTFRAEIRLTVLGKRPGEAQWQVGFLFDDLRLVVPREVPGQASEDVALLFTDRALVFHWPAYELDGSGQEQSGLQLLPGMHLEPNAAPGFVALAFEVLRGGDDDVPTLRVTSSFVEALLSCRWGAFLQTREVPGQPTLEQVCGSSAGNLVFGYTGQSQGASWSESFLLNGFLELKDLISWPTAMEYSEGAAALTLPPAQSAPALAHVRHTLRIMFNQHRIPAGILQISKGDLVFQLAQGKSWQFLAVVEHQLIDVLPGAGFTAFSAENDRRWTSVQEIRLLAPALLKAQLLAHIVSGIHTPSPSKSDQPIGDVSFGIFGRGVRALLAEGPDAALDTMPQGALLVEASALQWVKKAPVRTATTTTLQFLPNGTQLAALSNAGDYAPTDPSNPGWTLLTMPFLGRLQARAFDGLDESGQPSPPALRVDSVLHLERIRERGQGVPLPPLPLAFSAWSDTSPRVAMFSAMDTAAGRTFSGLDPLALEESWFRLQNPAPEPQFPGLQSVLAAVPDTPARLARPVALAQAFHPVRRFYPPRAASDQRYPSTEHGDELIWRPHGLLVLQAVSSIDPGHHPPYGWLLTAAELASGGFLQPADGQDSATALRRYVGATQHAVALRDSKTLSSFAVSPYLSLEFRPAPREAVARLSVAELVAFDPGSRGLVPVASHVFEVGDSVEARRQILNWARESARRLSPESPAAIVRLRQVKESATAAGPGSALLSTAYAFAILAGVAEPGARATQATKLRAPVMDLRFRDGHFGGAQVPVGVRPFEIAAPQATGLQPLYLVARPPFVDGAAPVDWPWGWSALRASIRYTQESLGIVGGAGSGDATQPATLWWQALWHAVQYRSALETSEPPAGLPALFRARAISGLLPVLPAPPMPLIDPQQALGVPPEQPLGQSWQPVLPGSLRVLVVGARAGVFLAARHKLIRQDVLPRGASSPSDSFTLVSGSVPLQHRMPRPVPLLANRRDARDAALRPWASYFEPQRNAVSVPAPADEAFFAACDGHSARRLQMRLEQPRHGAIDREQGAVLVFSIAFEDTASTLDDWVVQLELVLAGKTWPFRTPAAPLENGQYRFEPVDALALSDALRGV